MSAGLLSKPDSGVHRNNREAHLCSPLAPLVLAANILTDQGEVTIVRLKNFKKDDDLLRDGVIDQIRSYLPSCGLEPKPKLWITVDCGDVRVHPEAALFQIYRAFSSSTQLTIVLRMDHYQSCMATSLGKSILKPQLEEQSPYKEALQSLLKVY